MFYEELDRLMEDFGKATEERRKSASTHLPLAVSVPQLIKKVWIVFLKVVLFSFHLIQDLVFELSLMRKKIKKESSFKKWTSLNEL